MKKGEIPADDYYEEMDGPLAMKKPRTDKLRRFDISRHHEEKSSGFKCSHCSSLVPLNPEMGTAHRNHCNSCLWSKHVDNRPGDRAAECQSGMDPIAVTLKIEGNDKYTGEPRLGDVMLVHRCTGCGACKVNRVAADDPATKIMSVFEQSQLLPTKTQEDLSSAGINIMTGDEGMRLISERLFGKNSEKLKI